MELLIDRIPSPLGQIILISDGSSLCALDFADYETRLMGFLHKRYESVCDCSALSLGDWS